MPRIAVGSGWSESLNKLREDAGEWLVGGNGAVQAAIIITWATQQDNPPCPRPRGALHPGQKWHASSCSHWLTTKEAYLPDSPRRTTGYSGNTTDTEDVFGRSVRPGSNPRDSLELGLDALSRRAKRKMKPFFGRGGFGGRGRGGGRSGHNNQRHHGGRGGYLLAGVQAAQPPRHGQELRQAPVEDLSAEEWAIEDQALETNMAKIFEIYQHMAARRA
ncbi:uncharacterized protein P174DRAFT_505784 [Aspergillus novofumigatus IBT 16806]|uniref:Uncharacterized protein n=1 Tax=Aspergillus novofumigatus (strain IBT 16806) TaxID=1392255 RepID=A0A2I1C2A6_ASPN1|nr:uncharacterized protein P174DRAFT_505784 [Aspergillus novofumigatus IBT 16806]PKX91752.1 hypothetical protein P174DRAFT_505784 [Aspergillus novofumigatus IBT 16806]